MKNSVYISNNYTKRYYAGTQRVFSKIGTTENLGDYLQDWVTQGTGGPVNVVNSSFEVLENAEEGVIQVYDELGIDPPTYDSSPVFIPVQSFVHGENEVEQYFFHPDHLGSTSYISNILGEVSQHMEYFAFGETFVEEHRSSNNSPYKFNGKELDEETGWYYYGARYYDPRGSVWLSVDPLTKQTMTPYQYTYLNPIRYIDPDGRKGEDIIILNVDGSIRKVYNDGSSHITIIDPNYKGKFTLSSYRIDKGFIYRNNRNRQIVGNISEYYGKQVGVSGIGATYVKRGVAHYDDTDNGIWITPQDNGRTHQALNNKYNLQNILIHENLHKSGNYESTYIGHSEVYLGQINHQTFNKTSEEFKKGTIGSFANHIMNAMKNKEKGVDSMIEKFNNLKTGYELQIGNFGGGLEAKIIDTKNNNTYRVRYEKLNSPAD